MSSRLADRCDAEQTALKAETERLRSRIDTQSQHAENPEKFIAFVKSHIEDGGLTGCNLHELIQVICIENRDVELGDSSSSSANETREDGAGDLPDSTSLNSADPEASATCDAINDNGDGFAERNPAKPKPRRKTRKIRFFDCWMTNVKNTGLSMLPCCGFFLF